MKRGGVESQIGRTRVHTYVDTVGRRHDHLPLQWDSDRTMSFSGSGIDAIPPGTSRGVVRFHSTQLRMGSLDRRVGFDFAICAENVGLRKTPLFLKRGDRDPVDT